ncbi:MAG: hypothetical protein AVDCRST_MAG93-7312 [uncultured Chloroflexia bacterium]|uniref:Uncharacterized protein n=1 Tax=uncultured Chloroflexia bacterium TaxID=1672391 RepID=A0A6J4MBM2_9CHLR|nr:MAG: hypothetical protein AVDCRST_MAG93-7312 [uncultured Chloroflexia bacterium]
MIADRSCLCKPVVRNPSGTSKAVVRSTRTSETFGCVSTDNAMVAYQPKTNRNRLTPARAFAFSTAAHVAASTGTIKGQNQSGGWMGFLDQKWPSPFSCPLRPLRRVIAVAVGERRNEHHNCHRHI